MKAFSLKKTIRFSLLSLMMLGYLSETLPQLHYHAEQHACVEEDGLQHTQVFLPSESAAPSTGDRLQGVLHDGGHEHALCALCQLLPSLLGSSFSPGYFDAPDQLLFAKTDFGRTEKRFKSHRSRGPPTQA